MAQLDVSEQIDVSEQTTEWLEEAIIVNIERFERRLVLLNSVGHRAYDLELDELDGWISELQQELNRRKSA